MYDLWTCSKILPYIRTRKFGNMKLISQLVMCCVISLWWYAIADVHSCQYIFYTKLIGKFHCSILAVSESQIRVLYLCFKSSASEYSSILFCFFTRAYLAYVDPRIWDRRTAALQTCPHHWSPQTEDGTHTQGCQEVLMYFWLYILDCLFFLL